ncbi:MAG: hypothetical protein KIS92_26995, partial [Planctomycetota bacterium]|nr:hypothetical protein [Planctomycetota bacterium]
MTRARLPRWASFAVLAAALAHNTWRSWLCWGDLVSDCGRDLDIALAVLKGVPLYAQATYLYGPLPPFLNAGLFLLFGVHANVLMAAGWLSALAATALVYRIVKLFAGRWTATWCGVAFLYLCAFGHYSMNAIFNWMLPYTYAATYGMLFAVASLYFLLKHIRRPRPVLVWLSALCAAGAALCKLEALLPCCSLHALYLVFLWRTRAPNWKAAAGAYAGALVLVLGVYGWFWHTTGPALATGNILLRGNVTDAPRHRDILGLTDPARALALAGGSCLAFAAALLAARLAEALRG